VVTLFDATVNHQGWRDPLFENAGWQDVVAPLATGLSARSFWVAPINAEATDIQLGLTEGPPPATQSGYFFVLHANVQQQRAISPVYPVTPNTRLHIYTRVPINTMTIAVRAVLSDQATTPPPTTPP